MKVVICEPHPFHYEVILSSIYYFHELKWDVDILVRNNFSKEDVLCRCSFSSHIRVIKGEEEDMKLFLNCIKPEDYDICFFNSMEFFHDGIKERYLDYLGFIPDTRYGVMGIYHNSSAMNDEDIRFLNEGRIFSLVPFSYKGISTKAFSAVFFGDLYTEKSVECSPKFLSVGASGDKKLIESAAYRLYREKNESRMIGIIGNPNIEVKQLIKNIVVLLADALGLKTRHSFVDYKRNSNVKYYGKLGFKEMFALIEKCSYLLVAFDPSNPEYDAYKYGKVSGTRQLSIGFQRPCIISKCFRDSFDLSEDVCIAYEDNKVFDAIEKAMNTTDVEFERMSHNLSIMKENEMNRTVRIVGESIEQLHNT